MVSARRSPRIGTGVSEFGDPDAYIRVVKGGKYQARPYVSEESRRYDLGLFHTRHSARRAISDFWWGKRKPLPPTTRAYHLRNGTTVYRAVFRDCDRVVSLGPFATREAAADAAREYLAREYARYPLVLWLTTLRFASETPK
jgi:hypothetical protein